MRGMFLVKAPERVTLCGRLPDGYMRSSVYFSILADEWPAAKAALVRRLAD